MRATTSAFASRRPFSATTSALYISWPVAFPSQESLITMTGKEVIRAPLMFTKAGRAAKLNPTKEIAFGLTLGLAFGVAWEVRRALRVRSAPRRRDCSDVPGEGGEEGGGVPPAMGAVEGGAGGRPAAGERAVSVRPLFRAAAFRPLPPDPRPRRCTTRTRRPSGPSCAWRGRAHGSGRLSLGYSVGSGAR